MTKLSVMHVLATADLTDDVRLFGYDPNELLPINRSKAVLVSSLRTIVNGWPILTSEVGVTDIKYYYGDVRRYGAKGDGVTDDSTAFNNAIASIPGTTGVITAPAVMTSYVINSVIDPGSKAVTIKGDGWKSLIQGLFGDNAQWLAAGAITGTVLKVTSTNDGIRQSNATGRKLILRDLALLGPGTGTSVGINLGTGAQSNQAQINNVLVANFYKGVRLDGALDGGHYGLFVRGCTTGISCETNLTDTKFYDLSVEVCTTAIDAKGSGFHIYGGLIQSNTLGIKFTAASGVQLPTQWHIQGVWFEGNTNAWSYDSTLGPITDISMIGCRVGTAFTIPITLVNAIARLSFINCNFSPVTFNTVSGMQDIFSKNTKWLAFDPSGTTGVDVYEANGRYPMESVTDVIVVSPGATYTPDWSKGNIYRVTLDQNVTINRPTKYPQDGATITYIIRQDATGGRTVTLGTGLHGVWSDTGNTANKFSSISFRHIGAGTFVQVGAQSPYFT